ncbi:hypothetical protein ACI2IX_20105 [Leifsonia aquatica]|uniref:hypothetical protein n=1 Tax=Leifsonia aquatica TaxID=144185 RepID=UPI00384DB17D
MSDRNTSLELNTPRSRSATAARVILSAVVCVLILGSWILSLSLLGEQLTWAVQATLKPAAALTIALALDLIIATACLIAVIRLAQPGHAQLRPAERMIVSVGVGMFIAVLFVNVVLGAIRSRAADFAQIIATASGSVLLIGWAGAVLCLIAFVLAARSMHRAVMRLLDPVAGSAASTLPAAATAAAGVAARFNRELSREFGPDAVRDVQLALPENATDEDLRSVLEHTRANYDSLSAAHRARHEAQHAVVAYATGAIVVSADIHQAAGRGGRINRLLVDQPTETSLRNDIAVFVAPIATAVGSGDFTAPTTSVARSSPPTASASASEQPLEQSTRSSRRAHGKRPESFATTRTLWTRSPVNWRRRPSFPAATSSASSTRRPDEKPLAGKLRSRTTDNARQADSREPHPSSPRPSRSASAPTSDRTRHARPARRKESTHE